MLQVSFGCFCSSRSLGLSGFLGLSAAFSVVKD